MEMQNRIELWKCMSEFYLDTKLEEEDYIRIAKIMKSSNLTIKELKEIDLYEVYPILQKNLDSLAGEWAGFNGEWLKNECSKSYRKKNNKIFRFLTKCRNKRDYWMRKKHWDKIEKLLNHFMIKHDHPS